MKWKYLGRQVLPVGVSQLSVEEIGERLHDRYRARGMSHSIWKTDWSLLRRIGVHPANATVADLEHVVAQGKAASTRALYVSRFRAIFDTLQELGVCSNDAARLLPEVRKPRGLPRPLTDAEAARLMRDAGQPFRDWFILGCLAGLRAIEVSRLRGSDLELGPHGWVLHVHGKGDTRLTIPAHDTVVALIQSYGTNGRLWTYVPNKVSHYACREMRRLGVDKQFHACRHWYATALLAASNDITVVQTLMRHASVSTSMVYAKLAQDRPRQAINALAMPAA